MTTLIPKFDLKNGGTTPPTAVNRPIYDKLAETVSIKDLGAVGDGDYTASTYGTVGYTQEEKEYKPYADLTQEEVIGWVQESLGKDTVEASLATQIEALKNPVSESGLPWATPVF